MSDSTAVHILVFPYPAAGHIIPVLDLTHQLLTRGLTVTVLVTPPHLSLVQPLLLTHPPSSIHLLLLTPPDATLNPLVPKPIANMRSLTELYNPISDWFKSHPSPPVAIISGMFLGWTHHLASDLGVPRIVFWSSAVYSMSIYNYLWRELPKPEDENDENSILALPKAPGCPQFPWWHISNLYRYFKQGDPNSEFLRNTMLANTQSWGSVFNSFATLEGLHLDHLKKEMGHDRVWAVGPLLPSDDDLIGPTTRGGSTSIQTNVLMEWLDSKGDDQVVYVCFGSLWTITDQQVIALADALELSNVHFIWVLKEADISVLPKHDGFTLDAFEERVKGRGFLIKGWAPQVVILRHRAVGAFVTHCGWNSVLEGLSAGALLLTWPLSADQFLNTKLLVDELGVAIRFCEVGNRAIPESSELAKLLATSVGDSSQKNRVRVMEMRKAASETLRNGSSSRDLDILVQQLRGLNHEKMKIANC